MKSWCLLKLKESVYVDMLTFLLFFEIAFLLLLAHMSFRWFSYVWIRNFSECLSLHNLCKMCVWVVCVNQSLNLHMKIYYLFQFLFKRSWYIFLILLFDISTVSPVLFFNENIVNHKFTTGIETAIPILVFFFFHKCINLLKIHYKKKSNFPIISSFLHVIVCSVIKWFVDTIL